MTDRGPDVLMDMIQVREQLSRQLQAEADDYKTALRVAYPERYREVFGMNCTICHEPIWKRSDGVWIHCGDGSVATPPEVGHA